MRDMVRPALVLFVICLVVGAAMAFTNMATAEVIEQRIIEDAEASRKIVMPGADEFIKLSIDKIKTAGSNDYDVIYEVYAAQKSGSNEGYVFFAKPAGFGGEISIMIGIDAKGAVKGVDVGDNSETPGLGSKAKDVKFTGQFAGRKYGKISVVKGKAQNENEVEAISGATITSKAVSKAVEQASALADALLNNKLGVSVNELVESN